MATVVPTITNLQTFGDTAAIVSWTPLTSTNTDGDAFAMPGWADRSVHISGTFGSATVVLKGSINGTTYVVLTDPQGNAISKTSEAIEAISELVRFIKPTSSGGDGTQSVTVTLIARRP